MYKVEIFTDQFVFASVAMVDSSSVTIEQDFLAYDSFTITTPVIACEKGYFIHITTDDNTYIADGVVGDVQPEEKMQSITIRPLNTLFDAEVFYTPITDCISWLATNINSTFMSNADTVQNRPIHLTYTQAGDDLPLTGYNLHETTNLLSVMISALKTYGVVVKSRLDLTYSRLDIEIFQQSATKTLEASLANVLEKSVTIGDSYGSTNKAVIRKIKVVDNVTTVISSTSFYLHTDGTISTTNSDRIVPVFYAIENLEQTDDMSNQDWTDQATSRAKEILEPAKYDNEIVLQYDSDDLLATPMALEIGTLTTIYLDGESYASILTGKRIEAGKVTLIFGVTRTELTKQMNMNRRESMSFESTVSATLRQVAEKFVPAGEVTASSTVPKMDGTASTGTETAYARGDHRHPKDTSKLDVSSISPVNLLNETAVGTTATSYACDWDSYEWLNIRAGTYSNIQTQMMVDHGYFNGTTSGTRPMVYLPDGTYYQIYKSGSSHVYLRRSSAGGANDRIVIQGIIPRS